MSFTDDLSALLIHDPIALARAREYLMKRTPLKRGKPLARSSKPMKRTRMKRGRRAVQPPERRNDAFLAFCRKQRCAMCSRPPPTHAHHPRTGAGVGIKSSDETCVSLCLSCHSDLHALCGKFKGFERATLRAWEAQKNRELREAYEKEGMR